MISRRKKYAFGYSSLFFIFLFLSFSSLSAAQEGLGRGRLTGTVVDDSGSPIDGASLLAASLTIANAKLEGTSDAKGRFALAGFGTGQWRITAQKNGYKSVSVEINVRQLVPNPPLTLTLKKETGVAAFLQDDAASKLFDTGSRLFEEAKYDEAVKVFEEILAKFPEIYSIRIDIGIAYLKKEDLAKAAVEFQGVLDKVIQMHGSLNRDVKTSTRALSGLGEVALKKGDFESVQKYFAQALEISPEDEVAAYNVAEIYFSNGNVDEAIKYFGMAAAIKKDWPKPYYKLGVVYLNKCDFAKALEQLNTFLRIAPEDPEAPQVRAMIATIEKIKK
jgi:tetratricopeptide (TPR) repeat protein